MRRWVTKYILGIYGTGVKMKQWKQIISDKCPRCRDKVEYLTHVVSYNDKGENIIWDLMMIDVE